MAHPFTVTPIGETHADDGGFRIVLYPQYRQALAGLEGFSHIQLLWWFSGCDGHTARATLSEARPYKKAPDTLGTFATRSPRRPNPIALSCAAVTYLDVKNGAVGVGYLDAENHSPVLDIKPYTPSLDRVESPGVPAWCTHWPTSVETSGNFDWEAELVD